MNKLTKQELKEIKQRANALIDLQGLSDSKIVTQIGQIRQDCRNLLKHIEGGAKKVKLTPKEIEARINASFALGELKGKVLNK